MIAEVTIRAQCLARRTRTVFPIGALALSFAELGHGDLIAAAVVDDLTHECLDQEQPSPTNSLNIVISRWIGDLLWIEAGTIVGNLNTNVLVRKIPLER